MADLIDEFNRLKVIVAKAQATGNTAVLHKKLHVIDHEEERERKAKNPQKSTRIVFDSGSPDYYKRFHAQRQRYCDIAKDMGIGMELILRALESRTDADIKGWVEEGGESEEPEWLR